MASKKGSLKTRSNAKSSPNKSRGTPDLDEKSSPSANLRDSGSKVSLRGNNTNIASASYQGLIEENEVLKTSLSQSESTKERYLKHISRQEGQLAALEESRRHADGQAAAFRERLDACGMDLRRLREERDDTRRQCEALREDLQAQKNRCETARSEVETLTREMRMAEGERREALEKCALLREDLRRVNERLIQAEDEQALPKVDGAALASGFNSSGLREAGMGTGGTTTLDGGMGMLVLGGPSARMHEVAGNEMIHMLTGLNRLILDIASSAIKIPSSYKLSASQVSLDTPVSDLKSNLNINNTTAGNTRPNSWIADVLHPALVKHLAGPRLVNSTDTAWGMLAIGTVLQHSVARYVEAWPVSPSFETASTLGKEFLAAYDTLRREGAF